MRKALLVVLILSSALAWAQGGCTGQKPLNGMTTGGFLKGVANASVRVCSDALTPCTTIPLYSDAALTQSISNPVTTDVTGNYQYCAAPGSYNEQISGSGISGSVNNTPVTLSGDATVYVVDAVKQSGVDMCAKINASWAKGSRVDATGFHGVQACAASPFSSVPFTAGSASTFKPVLLLAPDVTIQTDVAWVLPGDLYVDGGSRNVIGCGAGCGATVQVSNAFSGSVIIWYGASSTFAGANPPEGIWLEGVNVNGQRPSGGRISPLVGIRNDFAQNHSGGRVYISNVTTCLAKDNNGGPSNTGSENDGPWSGSCQLNAQNNTDIGIAVGQNSSFQVFSGSTFNDWIIQTGTTAQRTTTCSTNTDTSLVCASGNFTSADVGSVVSGTNITSGTRVASVTNSTTAVLSATTTGTGSGISTTIKVQPNVCVAVDSKWGTQQFNIAHFEGCKVWFELGAVSGAQSVHIMDANGTALAGGLNADAVVDISSANAASTSAIVLSNIRCGGICTNILFDHNTNGGQIPGTSQFDGLGLYVREKNNQVFSTRPEIQSTFQPTLNNIASPTGNTTTDLVDKTWTVSSSGTTGSANMVTFRDQVGDTGNGTLLSCLSVNGTSGHSCLSIQKQGVYSLTDSRSTGNITFKTLVNATVGVNQNSPTFFFGAKIWNGASADDSMGLQNKCNASATNPSCDLTVSHVAGTTGATGFAAPHLNQTVTNAFAGTVTVSASTTGSTNFAAAFNSAPLCTLTPTADPTAVGVWWVTSSTTAVTATVKTSGTITFNYHCVGNPN